MAVVLIRVSTRWAPHSVHVQKDTCWPMIGKLATVSFHTHQILFKIQDSFLFFLDIDECDYDPDDDQDRLCPAMCRNTIGSYVCVDPDEEPLTCQPGYEPKEDDGLCQGIFSWPGSSIFKSSYSIRFGD